MLGAPLGGAPFGAFSNSALQLPPDGGTVSAVTSVTVSPASVTLPGGGTRQFYATVNGSNSPSQAVTWSGSFVDTSGLFTAPAATSSVQTFTVTARSVQDNSYSGTATVTIQAVAPHMPPPQFTSTIHSRARHRGRR